MTEAAPNLLELSPERRALLELLLAAEEPPAGIPRLAAGSRRPLSFAQERMWLAEQFAQGTLTGVVASRTSMRGRPDVAALERAFNGMLLRHDVLRSAFVEDDGLQQRVQTQHELRLPVIDLSPLAADERELHLLRAAEEAARRPFDLARGPLIRAALYKCGEAEYELLSALHHSVYDGWSVGIFARDFAELYAAFSQGRSPRLAPLPIQYADYAAWQREQVQRPEVQTHLAYWKRQLGGRLPTIALPADRPPPRNRTFAGASYEFELPAALCRRVQELSRQAGATPFMTLLAGFKALLYRLTGQDDLVVGSPFANRDRAELAELIGCFMQPMVLRTRLSGKHSFLELLAEVRRVCLEAYAHQGVPFELIVRAIHPHWDGRHLPLFQVMFNVQSASQTASASPSANVTSVALDSGSSGLDLSVHLWVDSASVRGMLEYSTELFDEDTILWLLDGYVRLLEGIVADPQARLAELKLAPRRQTAVAPSVHLSGLDLSPERRELLAALLAEQGEQVKPIASQGIPRLERNGQPLPTSFGQERLWISDQLLHGQAVFNQAQGLHISGPLNVSAFRQALDGIFQRHESLRTSFRAIDGQPRQIVTEDFTLPVPLVDLSCEPADVRERRVQALADEQCRQPFDLERLPLARMTLVRCTPQEHVLLMTVHHMVEDGWSLRVFRRELALLYDAFSRGLPTPLAPLAVQYADFAAWQRRTYRDAVMDGQLVYWQQWLGGEIPVLDLPADHPRPAGLSRRRKTRLSFELPDELHAAIAHLGRQEGVTLFMALLASFQALLHRYTGQEDILVDSPIAGRNRAELEGLIGFFVNSLALRVDLSGRPTFRQLLARVRQTCLGAYAHQDLPFDKVVAQVQQARRGQPLTPVSFMLHEAITERLELADGVVIHPLEPDLSDEFDLTLVLWRGSSGLSGEIQYDRDQFDETTIRHMAGHFRQLLTSAVANPDRRLADLTMLPTEEQQLLAAWRQTHRPHESVCVQQLFEAQVQKTPQAIAAVLPSGDAERPSQQWTYEELNRRANQLAHLLRARGIGPESRVGICLDRSLEMLVTVLGVLKAGGAYVPLDAAYSKQRLEFILQDAEVSVLLTRRELVEQLPLGTTPRLALEELGDELSRHATTNPEPLATPNNLAYLMYTSGSTGRPKGALIAHRNLVNAYHGWEEAYRLRTETTCHLQMASFSFDVFAGDLVRALCSGARLVLCPREILLDPQKLYELMRWEQVDCAEFVPAIVRALVQHLEATPGRSLDFLRLMLVGSDVWYKGEYEQTRRLCGPHTRLINSYGVAEATIDSSYFESRGAPLSGDGQVPIGRPFANSQLHVLDRDLQPLPIGVAGELYLGGAGLARSYLNRPELTAEKFVPDPFSREPGARLYRTGDRARYLVDGNLEFLGRADHQVKIRGFRIEPGEIESVLGEHPAVRQAVVMVRTDFGPEKRLVAYIAATPGGLNGDGLAPLVKQLREFLQERLPDYMVPSALVLLDAIPLSPNGKVDRRSLPAPDPSQLEAEQSYVAPRTQAEELLAGIWSEVLGIERIGVHDNFFELGGDSILAIRVISKANDAGLQLSPMQVFERPTVADLARAAGLGESIFAEEGPVTDSLPPTTRLEERRSPPIVPARRDVELPVSFAQQRLWLLDQISPGSWLYNAQGTVRLRGTLDIAALEKSISEIVRRHEALRTIFPAAGGRPIQVIVPPAPFPLPITDLSGLPRETQEQEAQRQAAEEVQRPFDLAHGPLLRVGLLRFAEDDHAILLTMHHIIVDGWSIRVVIRELGALYQAFARGHEPLLPELPIQYADFAVWQREWLQGELLEQQLGYWKTKLAGMPVMDLPLDRPRLRQLVHFDEESLELSLDLSASVVELSRRESATLFMTLLAAFDVLLSRYCRQDSVVLGTTIAGRNQREIQNLVGFFVNTLVLRNDLSGDPSFRELLRRTRQMALEAYAHQDLPFERLVQEVQPERDLVRSPLFQILFNMLNFEEQTLDLPGLKVEQFSPAGFETKFDLTVNAHLHRGQIWLRLAYNTDLFDSITIRRMAGHLQTLLSAIAADPERPISQLPLQPAAERRQIVQEFNGTHTQYRRDVCLHQLFEEQVARTPDAVALVFEEQRLTYRELDQRANQLAHYLRELGVGTDTPVGVCAERSVEMVVALYGILKAGGAYAPLDPEYPAERLAYMVENSRAPVVLVQERLRDALPEFRGRVVGLDSQWNEIAERPAAAPPNVAHPQSIAYVIYTSGSTGRPKGVMVPHAGICNRLFWMQDAYRLDASDRVLQKTPFSFDVSVWEFFWPLLYGSTLVVARPGGHRDPSYLSELIQREQITTLHFVPSMLQAFLEQDGLEQCGTLRRVICSGEALPYELTQRFFQRIDAELHNLYGPTEASVDVTAWACTAASTLRLVPIGKPIANTQTYVLDGSLQPVPIGVPGELYLGGVQLARGYANRPDLTAERFVPDPFSSVPGSRLYRTGDLVRLLPDGNIDFLGRLDHQVKIRGFRIELSEIEAVLGQHECVREAAVLARQDAPGEHRLVAYLVAAAENVPDSAELRAHLWQRLPEYMLPSAFVWLDALPLSASGKLDRRALPAPEGARTDLKTPYAPPGTETEIATAEIWQALFGFEPIGLHDDFFELGGHSLMALQLLERLRVRFGVNLALASLFEHRTIEDQARHVDAALWAVNLASPDEHAEREEITL